MVGRRIGRFEVLSLLGKGGMGSVWKAEDTLLGRAVAIKVLSDELAQDDESRRRFRREGEISAQLDHPGICMVYEAGEQDGLAWLAMACIDGVTLSNRTRERLMPIAEVLRVGRMAAGALAHAHARDVVHRDVTARNIMLARDGRVVLLDFGLAIVSDASRITGPGAVVGTIAYMAPELLAGGNATPQSDLYGLGVVLYEALTGARPFHSENAEALRYRVLQETPEPVRALRPAVPEALEAVVMKAMARTVEERFAGAAEMLEALEGCEADVRDESNAAPGSAAPRVAVKPSSEPPREASSSADTALAQASADPARDLAERIAAGAQPVYLALLPIEDASAAPDAGRRQLLDDLIETTAASLSDLERVRVVSLAAAAETANLRNRARRAGANLVLLARARAEGTSLRLTFSFIEPESGTRIAGGTVDGSLLEPFRLEDRFIDAAAAALHRDGRPRGRAARQSDPAARNRFAQAMSYMQRLDHEASLDGAVRLLEGLIASEGETAPVLASLARAWTAKYRLTRQRDWEARAVKACDRAARLDPEDAGTMLASADLLILAGRPAEAIPVLARALERGADPREGLIVRSRAHDLLGKNRAAEADCHEAITLDPQDWRAHHQLGLLHFRHGRYDEAIVPWAEVTRLCPDNAGAHRNLGGAYFHLDRYEEAIEGFRRSIAINPNAMAYYNLATTLFFLERYEESLAAYEQAVDLNPSDPVAWGNLGSACRFIPGNEARMREALERAIAIGRERLARDPSHAESWARLASWYSNLGRDEEALEAIREALFRGPDDVHCMVSAGHVYLRAGHRTEALRRLDDAVRHGYGVKSLERDPELTVLRDDPEFRRIIALGARERSPGTSIPRRPS